MKKILIIFIIVVIYLVGCGANEVKKEEAQSITYLDYRASNALLNGQSNQLKELGIPKSYENETDYDTKNMKLEIDAEVIIPDVETMSIYSVTSDSYDAVDLNQLSEAYYTAKGQGDMTFETFEYGMPCHSILLSEEGFATDYAVLENEPITTIDGEIIYPLPEQIQGEFSLTPNRIEEVEVLLEKMGMTDLVYTSGIENYAFDTQSNESFQLKRIFKLTFMRTYEGVPTLVIRKASIDYTYQMEDQIWREEQVHVILDEEEVQSIEFVEPYEEIEVYLSDVNLLPYESVMELMEQMLEMQDPSKEFASYGMNENVMITYHVDKIELGMTKITDFRGEEGLVVPAWDFQGDVIISDMESSYTQTIENVSIITLNAVDGTVIL